MNTNLPAMKYAEVAKSAMALASQTETAGKTHPNPMGNDLTLKVFSLATQQPRPRARKMVIPPR